LRYSAKIRLEVLVSGQRWPARLYGRRKEPIAFRQTRHVEKAKLEVTLQQMFEQATRHGDPQVVVRIAAPSNDELPEGSGSVRMNADMRTS